MTITRRVFLASAATAGVLPASGAAAGVVARERPRVVLEAISGPRLPETIELASFLRVAFLESLPYFERREYRSDSPEQLDILKQLFESNAFSSCGLRPLGGKRPQSLAYWFGFVSLKARAEAWTLVAAHPAWIQLRDSVGLAGVSVYRRAPAPVD